MPISRVARCAALALLAACCAASGATATQPPDAAAEERLVAAAQALENGNSTQARALLTEALELRPSPVLRARLLCERGALHRDGGRFEQAAEDFNAAIAADAKCAPAYAGRASLHLIDGKNDDALADLSTALRHDPTNTVLLEKRGSIWLIQGEERRALADFRRLVELQPFERRFRFLLAKGYVAAGAMQRAVEQLNLALGDVESESRAGAQPADGSAEARPPAAAEDPLDWLPLGAETAEAYFLRSTARTALGRSDEAMRDIRRALSIAPRSEIYRAQYHRLRSRPSK